MLLLKVHLEGEGCWPDLQTKEVIDVADGVLEIAALNGGMESGKAWVAIRVPLPDGRIVIVGTSMTLFQAAAAKLKERHGN